MNFPQELAALRQWICWRLEPDPKGEKPRKVPAPDAEPVLTHKVAYSDIDFNRHVNTMRYIEMMLDVLPIERFAEERPLRLDINFLKEARYGSRWRSKSAVRRRSSRFAAMPARPSAAGRSNGGSPVA